MRLDDVGACLQQIEHLLSTLVRRGQDDVTDVDIDDRLASTDDRRRRANRSLNQQLRQAIRENKDLQLSVERLQFDARRL